MSLVCCLLLCVSVVNRVGFCFPCHVPMTLPLTLFESTSCHVLISCHFPCSPVFHFVYLNPTLSSLVCQIASVLVILGVNLTFVGHLEVSSLLPVFVVLTSVCLVPQCIVALGILDCLPVSDCSLGYKLCLCFGIFFFACCPGLFSIKLLFEKTHLDLYLSVLRFLSISSNKDD